MEVLLLGTGSADGWPNPFCGCASCRVQSAAGELRGPTAALVDDVLLIDCGTGAPAAALAAGRRLDRLRAVLLTHDHPDHSAPMALLARTWAGRDEPIDVVGPAAVLDTWRQWSGPDDPVTFRPVTAGDTFDLDGYRVQVLPAEHAQPAVLYLVEDDAGHRLLYATDTGPLPPQAVEAAVRTPVDLLLLDETFGDAHDHGADHLDLVTFPRELARLRGAGALREAAEVVAVHLGHHNPPSPRLDERLAVWGARAGTDGEVLTVPRTDGTRTDDGSPAGSMPHRTLVLGGARSGKSTTAERLLAAVTDVVYVATGPLPDASDAEWAARVRRHREQRPASWTTVETTDAAAALRSASRPVLLDCLATWLAAAMAQAGAWDELPGWQQEVERRVVELVAAWRDVHVPVVGVTNEVGSGVVPATVSGGLYRDWLGRLNQRIANESERVLLVVAGRVLDLDGGR